MNSNLDSPNSLNSQLPFTLGVPAMHGLAGDVVGGFEPHTEAASAAILAQFLAALGNVVGLGPHFKVEDDYHALKVYPMLVGQTSKGRKGTSWGRVNKLFEAVRPDWTRNNVIFGLSSAEGLIHEVRDEADSLVGTCAEKCRLIIESEFASVLKRADQNGNTLSQVIRQAFDGSKLRTLTKNNPVMASSAHVTIVGHITRDDALRYLDATDQANGFGNRFLWIGVTRSKLLPYDNPVPEAIYKHLCTRLTQVIDFASTVKEMRRDEAANRLWSEIYTQLSEERPGITGTLTARGEAYVMRIACLYGLLDLSTLITPSHLLAGRALWDYSEKSVDWIFGRKFGDPIADKIASELQRNLEGLSRTAIHGLFGRHEKAGRIDAALVLLDGHLTRTSRITAGRTEEILKWRI